MYRGPRVIIHPSNTYLFHTAALYKDFLYQAQPDVFETFCCRSRRLLILWSNDLYQCDKNGGILLGNISIRPKTPRATIYSAEQGPGIIVSLPVWIIIGSMKRGT
jgi:hypothetical protein